MAKNVAHKIPADRILGGPCQLCGAAVILSDSMVAGTFDTVNLLTMLQCVLGLVVLHLPDFLSEKLRFEIPSLLYVFIWFFFTAQFFSANFMICSTGFRFGMSFCTVPAVLFPVSSVLCLLPFLTRAKRYCFIFLRFLLRDHDRNALGDLRIYL